MNPEYARLRSLGYKTLEEFYQEQATGTISSISFDEINKAKALERASFPADIRYPNEGDIYVAKEEVEINYLTTWEAPYTGGGKGFLPKNAQIIIEELFEEQPIIVSCKAVNYAEIEKIIIPKEDREAGKYSGYYISAETLLLYQKFELIVGE